MANRWGSNGNSDRLYFLGSKITLDGDCSHEIKRCLLLGKQVMTNLDSILKSRDITLPTKVCLVKAIVFLVVMYGCESQTIKLSTEELMLLNCGVGAKKKIKSDTVSTVSPSISHEVMGPDAMILVFWILSFKPTFSLSIWLSPRGFWVPLHFLP